MLGCHGRYHTLPTRRLGGFSLIFSLANPSRGISIEYSWLFYRGCVLAWSSYYKMPIKGPL